MSLQKLVQSTLLFLIFLTLGFPLFYFVYKYGDPEPLAHDFFQYYHLFQRMDVPHVISPHNMRVVGAFFIYVFYKLNIYFDTAATFDKYAAWGFMKQVYFSAIFVNYIFVALTSLVIFNIVKRELKDWGLAFVGGLLYLFGFGTIFYCLMPLTEAFSILVFSVFLLYYRQRSLLVLVPMCLLIFQREYLLVMIFVIAGIDYFSSKNRYHLIVSLTAVLAFTVYYLLRKTVFYAPYLDYQSDPIFMLQQLLKFEFGLTEYIRQLILGLNLFFIYVSILIYKKWKAEVYDQKVMFQVFSLLIMVNIVSIAGGHGNNVGRYFYLTAPFLIINAMFELAGIIKTNSVGVSVLSQTPYSTVAVDHKDPKEKKLESDEE